MSNKFKEIDMKNRANYFCDDVVDTKNLDSNKIKMNKKSHQIILIVYIRYVTIRDLSYIKVNSVIPSYFMISKMNGYIEESHGNICLTLIPTDESKDIKEYEELWNKVRYLIRSKTNNSDNYDESDDLSLKKILERHNMVLVATSVFREYNKYYRQFFLDKFCIKYKYYILIESVFLKEFMLSKPLLCLSVLFVITGTLLE